MSRTPVAASLLLYISLQTSANEPREPVLAQVRHIGLPTKGKYLVREEVEKAPTYDDQPCELTETAVKISFPEEMRSEIFVNLLGYKEPNLLHLKRCKGRCTDPSSPLTCRATKVRDKKVKMVMRSVLTGKEPVDRVKELVLDEHEECGCECSPELASLCAGRFNIVTCDCECPVWQFGEVRAACEQRKETYWDSKACQCISKSIAPRGVDTQHQPEERRPCHGVADRHLNLLHSLDTNNRTLDMAAWVVLGSTLTLVIAFAVTTHHYRGRARKAEGKTRPATSGNDVNNTKYIYKDVEVENGSSVHKNNHSGGQSRKYQCQADVEISGGFDDGGHRMGRGKETVIMAGYCEEDGDQDADILDMETDEHGIPGCDKYNVHGVKLEHNCFI